MRRAGIIALAALIAAMIWWGTSRNSRSRVVVEEAATVAPTVTPGVAITAIANPTIGPAGALPPSLGEIILRDYANTNLLPANDLTLMARLMENAQLLLKSAANRPLSANEDWADCLRGYNSARERFLPDQHIALSRDGKLVDRWRTPLFFHALGGGRFELRSAGPDKKLWTADDIHRNADGSIRPGADLNPASLLPRGY